MAENNQTFNLRFFNEESTINPNSFNAKELGQLIISFYEGLKELLDVRYPEYNTEEFNLSLIQIENKSESLTWAYTSSKEVEDALLEYSNNITKKTYTDLPTPTYKSVRDIHNITKLKRCNAELVQKGNRLFIVTNEDSLIKQENTLIKSDLLIYGILNKIGGDINKAWVECYDGSRISFKITDEQLVKLRTKVKEPIALKGEAKWSAYSQKIVSFKLKEVIDYIPNTIQDGFDNLKKISTGWNDLSNDNIIKFLNGDT